MALVDRYAVVIDRHRQRYQLPQLLYTYPCKSKEFIDPVYLPCSEWKRIKNSLQKKDSELLEFNALSEEREKLRQKSKLLMEDWPDNPEYVKKMRFQSLQMKAKKEEAARVKLDQEEAEYRAQKKKESIERARKLLFAKTEKIQKLNKAYLMAYVHKEREKQVCLNKCQRAMEEKLEKEYENDILNNSLQVKKLILEEEKEKRRKTHENTAYIMKQIQEKKDRSEREKELDKHEAEVTDTLVKFHLQREKELQKIKEQKKCDEKMGYIQQMKEQQILNDYNKQLEKVNDVKIHMYVKAKQLIQRERKKIADEKRRSINERQSRAQKHLEVQQELVKEKLNKIEESIHQSEVEKDNAFEKRLQEEEEKRRRMNEEANNFYLEEIKNKQEMQKLLVEENLATLSHVQEDYKQYVEQEKNKAADRTKICQDINDLLKIQQEEKKLAKEYEQANEQLEYKYREEFHDSFDAEVDAYASKLYEDAKNKRWTTYPIEAAKYICDWADQDPLYVPIGKRFPLAIETCGDRKANTSQMGAV